MKIEKFKIGDKVRIRKNLDVGNLYDGGCFFNSCMKAYRGKKTKIIKIRARERYGLEDCSIWSFSPSMLEKIEEKPTLKIKRKFFKSLPDNFTGKVGVRNGFIVEIEEILDDVEKTYLSAVIKPFRNKIDYIEKIKTPFGKEYICIKLKDEPFYLLSFKEGTMYKGMETNRKYTLEELDL